MPKTSQIPIYALIPSKSPPELNLTNKQWEVAQYIATGLSNAEIRELLNIVPQSLDNHIAKIMRNVRASGIFSRTFENGKQGRVVLVMILANYWLRERGYTA